MLIISFPARSSVADIPPLTLRQIMLYFCLRDKETISLFVASADDGSVCKAYGTLYPLSEHNILYPYKPLSIFSGQIVCSGKKKGADTFCLFSMLKSILRRIVVLLLHGNGLEIFHFFQFPVKIEKTKPSLF